MLSILADECVDVQLVFRLRRLGYNVRTVREFCQSKYGDGISDLAVLELARQHRFAVLTANESHFLTLHRRCPWHQGILIVEVESDPHAQARRIDNVLKAKGEITGQVVWLAIGARKPSARKRRGR